MKGASAWVVLTPYHLPADELLEGDDVLGREGGFAAPREDRPWPALRREGRRDVHALGVEDRLGEQRVAVVLEQQARPGRPEHGLSDVEPIAEPNCVERRPVHAVVVVSSKTS